MRYLVTGAAGFIGYHVAKAICDRGDEVVGIDNLNDYYSVSLKMKRLGLLESKNNFSFKKIDLADDGKLRGVFDSTTFDAVIHLAAQAGVRYSISNPDVYLQSNLVGFFNILENCRTHKIGHLVYASSSSVYGANENYPLMEEDNVDHPVSLYAATKKCNEVMAHSYSHLYDIPTTGLRFFTVYGPWGRPDMSPILFANAIYNSEPLDVFNYGHHGRDFTYIDDIVDGILNVVDKKAQPDDQWSGLDPNPSSSKAPWRIYNIGSGSPVKLLDYIDQLEKSFNKTTQKNLLPMQPGDVEHTFASTEKLELEFDYRPSTRFEDGITKFVEWYKDNLELLK